MKTPILLQSSDNWPQTLSTKSTPADLFFIWLQKRSVTIELPDFLVPAIDVFDQESSVVVEVELPGIVLEDFLFLVEGDILHIRGEKRQSQAFIPRSCARQERRYGLFERKLCLPAKVSNNNIKISYEGGVLKLIFQKECSCFSNVS